jgi:hypothetical protein
MEQCHQDEHWRKTLQNKGKQAHTVSRPVAEPDQTKELESPPFCRGSFSRWKGGVSLRINSLHDLAQCSGFETSSVGCSRGFDKENVSLFFRDRSMLYSLGDDEQFART